MGAMARGASSVVMAATRPMALHLQKAQAMSRRCPVPPTRSAANRSRPCLCKDVMKPKVRMAAASGDGSTSASHSDAVSPQPQLAAPQRRIGPRLFITLGLTVGARWAAHRSVRCINLVHQVNSHLNTPLNELPVFLHAVTAVLNRLLFKAATVPLQNYVRQVLVLLQQIRSQCVPVTWSHAGIRMPLVEPLLQVFFLAQLQTFAYVAIYVAVLAVKYR